ncbi:MAG: GNAT family N-acetyltransferase [Alphaproteobacteria bacterium]|nr:GNAT family N-acetyltransferase [Alphaproteobacteria bacterium]
MKKFIPNDFEIPSGFLTDKMKARILTVNDVVKDYEAVMTSVEHLQGVFGSNSTWPSPNMSLEQDLIDLGWHQKEFQCRSSFAYTVMAPDESVCLGCFYIYPYDKDGYDAIVYMWVRKSEFDKGLDPILEKEVREFMKKWPFQKVLFYGRTDG